MLGPLFEVFLLTKQIFFNQSDTLKITLILGGFNHVKLIPDYLRVGGSRGWSKAGRIENQYKQFYNANKYSAPWTALR